MTPPAKLSWRFQGALFALALAVRAAMAALLDDPGYFDGYGYLRVAERMAGGLGMSEDFVWQHLDRSAAAQALPHASHLYWMPMASFLAWLGLRAGGAAASFHAAQAPFVLLSALLPLGAAKLSFALHGARERALQAGLVALFLGSYFARWVVPEPCTPFALAALGALVLVAREGSGARGPTLSRSSVAACALAGALAGAAHLARADGFLVAGAGALALLVAGRGRTFARPAAFVAGYVLVFAPWLARQHAVTGHIFSPGPLKTALFVSYDDIFAFETRIDAARFVAQGAGAVVWSRVEALGANLAELAGIFDLVLLPLAVAAAYALPRERRAQLAPVAIYAAALFLFMTLVTPYPARFGSLYRSSAALVPWVAALAPEGSAWAARHYAAWRGHPREPAARAMPWLVTAAVFLLSLAYQAKELGVLRTAEQEPWNARLTAYREIGQWLDAHGAGGPVLTTNAPGFTLATRRPSVMTPTDGASATVRAADRFGARYLVLESNLAWALATWRDGGELPGFRRVDERTWVDGLGAPVRLYERTE